MLEELKKNRSDYFLEVVFGFIGGNSVIRKTNKNLFWKVILIVFKAKQMQDDVNLALDTCLEFDVYSYFLWEMTSNTVFPMANVHTAEKQS